MTDKHFVQKKSKKWLLAGTGILLVVTIFAALLKFLNSRFEAPRQNTQPINYSIRKDTTIDAVVSDLRYYDFIKDESAFKYALKHSRDETPGRDGAIRVSSNTIDRESQYTISQSMTAWEIAKILLNDGTYISCDHGCPQSNFTPELLPGGELAPTIQQKYEWVKTYEDCVKAIGSDGGQLSSEQYYERTGIRKCVSPDSREFTEGKDGWTKAIGG